jgi:uncharacterized protein (TIGR02594 family)
MKKVSKILDDGSRGSEVKLLQGLLNKTVPMHMLPRGRKLAEDGIFGSKTEAAVESFQRMKGLSVDGEVGRNTWTALGVQYVGPSRSRSSAPEPLPADIPNAPWFKIANQEMSKGVAEIKGLAHNSRIIEYHNSTDKKQMSTDEAAWCAAFVNWCLEQVDVGGLETPWAASWTRFGKPCGAKPGAIAVVFDPNHSARSSGYHVAFLVRETHRHYVLLGGNQSGRVKVSRYGKSRWQRKAYRWPD